MDVTERTVRAWADQIVANVKVAGSGPPVVFLHGAEGLVWDAFLDGLAEDYTIYAPEHPGTTAGDPDAIKPIDDLWDLVLYYYEVFDQLKLDRPAVIGNSFGGMIGAELAATDPERVSNLVLIAPLGLWRDDVPIPNWMIMTPQELAQLIFHDLDGPVATEFVTPPEDEEERIEARLSFVWSYACTGKFAWPIPDKGLKKRIHHITAPTLLAGANRTSSSRPCMRRSSAVGSRARRLRSSRTRGTCPTSKRSIPSFRACASPTRARHPRC